MGDDINWLVTVLYGDTLLRCALQVKRDALPGDCAEYPMEPENRKAIHALLPLHVQTCGPIVAVEELFEVHIANAALTGGGEKGGEASAPYAPAAGSDGRCPTCRQRNSRSGEREMDDGSVIVWYCNVPGCANHADYPNAPRQPRRGSGVGLDAVGRRDGYQFCEKHQQEYRQYCSGCAVGTHAANTSVTGAVEPRTVEAVLAELSGYVCMMDPACMPICCAQWRFDGRCGNTGGDCEFRKLANAALTGGEAVPSDGGVAQAHDCCNVPPRWFRWPSGRWAVQCAKCGRIGCDAEEQLRAIEYWNAELNDTESVPRYLHNAINHAPERSGGSVQ